MKFPEHTITTPPQHSEHRRLFERAFRQNDIAKMSFISMGSRLEYARLTTMRSLVQHDDDVEAMLVKTEALRSETKLSLGFACEKINANLTTDYALQHRASLYNKLADQLSLLPVVFTPKVDNYDAHRIRKHLISDEGIYGIFGEALGEAFKGMEDASSEVEYGGLVGFINELTTMALFNREQNSNFIALPSLPSDDQLNQVDVDIFHYQSNLPRKTALQVKTSTRWPARANSVPIIDASMLNNTSNSYASRNPKDFDSTQMIIREISGGATDQDRRALNARCIALKNQFFKTQS